MNFLSKGIRLDHINSLGNQLLTQKTTRTSDLYIDV